MPSYDPALARTVAQPVPLVLRTLGLAREARPTLTVQSPLKPRAEPEAAFERPAAKSLAQAKAPVASAPPAAEAATPARPATLVARAAGLILRAFRGEQPGPAAEAAPAAEATNDVRGTTATAASPVERPSDEGAESDEAAYFEDDGLDLPDYGEESEAPPVARDGEQPERLPAALVQRSPDQPELSLRRPALQREVDVPPQPSPAPQAGPQSSESAGPEAPQQPATETRAAAPTPSQSLQASESPSLQSAEAVRFAAGAPGLDVAPPGAPRVPLADATGDPAAPAPEASPGPLAGLYLSLRRIAGREPAPESRTAPALPPSTTQPEIRSAVDVPDSQQLFLTGEAPASRVAPAGQPQSSDAAKTDEPQPWREEQAQHEQRQVVDGSPHALDRARPLRSARPPDPPPDLLPRRPERHLWQGHEPLEGPAIAPAPYAEPATAEPEGSPHSAVPNEAVAPPAPRPRSALENADLVDATNDAQAAVALPESTLEAAGEAAAPSPGRQAVAYRRMAPRPPLLSRATTSRAQDPIQPHVNEFAVRAPEAPRRAEGLDLLRGPAASLAGRQAPLVYLSRPSAVGSSPDQLTETNVAPYHAGSHFAAQGPALTLSGFGADGHVAGLTGAVASSGRAVQVQRQALDGDAAAPAATGNETAATAEAGTSRLSAAALEKLAQQVYERLRRRLLVERERAGLGTAFS